MSCCFGGKKKQKVKDEELANAKREDSNERKGTADSETKLLKGSVSEPNKEEKEKHHKKHKKDKKEKDKDKEHVEPPIQKEEEPTKEDLTSSSRPPTGLQFTPHQQSLRANLLADSVKQFWEFIDFDTLKVGAVLGEGSFGLVHKATWNGKEVALKLLKNVSSEQIEELAREAKLMGNLTPHPNVLRMYGLCLDPAKPMGIVVEYLEYGSLKDLLAKKVQLKFLEVVGIAQNVAEGMKHLQTAKIVHRDLSARNILVTKDAEGKWLCKVADFGLSRAITTELSKGQTQSSVGPLKWMAPESLIYKVYSVKSDVWSYGVTLVEILDQGQEPYPDLDAVQAASAVMHKGIRPRIPESCPAKLQQLLDECFSREPDKRPDFKKILDVLQEVRDDIESNPFYTD